MKKRIFFMATLMALVTVCALGQSARKYYKAGLEFVENLRYEDAVVQFTNALGLEPSNSDYYYARGQAYENLLKYPEAKADYEKVIVFSPKDADAVISLGAVCNKMNNFDDALRLLNHASMLDKHNPKVYEQKVITFIAQEKYDQALKVSDTTLRLKDTPMDYYYRGIIYRKLKNELQSKNEFEKAISKDKNLVVARLALADLIMLTNPMEAMNQCNQVLAFDARNTDAYLIRSEIYKKNLDYPNAINDISKNIMIDPTKSEFYLARGMCYQEFNQHANAIADFTKYISLKPDNPDAYFARAKSYEGLMSYDKAIEDYNKITALSEFDMKARKMLKDAQARLYELNRESDPPDITIVSPAPAKDTIEIRGDKPAILITGMVKDKSKIKSFMINNEPVSLTPKNGSNEFLSNIDVSSINKITFVATDDYDNVRTVTYALKRTPTNPPKISIIAPYTSEDGQVFLDSSTPNIAIQGKISDERADKINCYW